MNENEAERVAIWHVPAADFRAWLAYCADGAELSYDEYLARLLSAAGMCRQRGFAVEWVEMPVAEMLSRLAARDWPNTPSHRAAIALAAACGEEPGQWILGAKLSHNAIGWAMIESQKSARPGEEVPLRDGLATETVREAVGEILDQHQAPF